MEETSREKYLMVFLQSYGPHGRMARTPWATFSSRGVFELFLGGWRDIHEARDAAGSQFEFRDFRARMDDLHGDLHGDMELSYRALSHGD